MRTITNPIMNMQTCCYMMMEHNIVYFLAPRLGTR